MKFFSSPPLRALFSSDPKKIDPRHYTAKRSSPSLALIIIYPYITGDWFYQGSTNEKVVGSLRWAARRRRAQTSRLKSSGHREQTSICKRRDMDVGRLGTVVRPSAVSAGLLFVPPMCTRWRSSRGATLRLARGVFEEHAHRIGRPGKTERLGGRHCYVLYPAQL